MKLFLSALLLAAATTALAQNSASNQLAAQSATLTNDLVAHKVMLMDQTGCPLFLKSASVAPHAGYLPVDSRRTDDPALDLHFYNRSGKPIQSASITAHLRVKTNVYVLDAHPLDLHLTVSGTSGVDKALDQLAQIALPDHVYVFGVAQVTLDQVMFTDGSLWNASPTHNACATTGPAIDRIAK